jgi:hypothetical protein
MTADVLLLSRKPLAERPLWQWLDDTATHAVLVTTPSAVEGVAGGAGVHFRECVLVDAYQSWWTEWAAEQAARRHPVSLVATSSEDDVLRAARLRARLGLPGQGIEAALAYRDKFVMKQRARAAGIAVPAYAPLNAPGDLLDFVDAYGYPVVVKPRRGAGAVAVWCLRDPAALAAFLRSGHLPAAPDEPGRWLVESYVDAPMYHVDGVSVGGRVVHCWPSRYGVGNAEVLWSQAALTSIQLAPDNPRNALLRAFAEQVHAALPAGPFPTSFHLEAWVDADGTPVLCEVACRTGGGPVAATYEAAFGVHLSRENLRGQSGQSLSLTSQPAAPDQMQGWVILPPGTGRFTPPRRPCPVPHARVEYQMSAGTPATGPRHVGHSAATVAVGAPTAARVEQYLEEILAWWTGSDVWQ